jgi:hypothetical protein
MCRCRVEGFAGIVPRQPWIAENTTGEVRLEFEAILLDISRESSSKIWIHVRIMACTDKEQCSQVGGKGLSADNHLGFLQEECGYAWRVRRSIEDQTYEVGIAEIMAESQGLMVEREIVIQDRLRGTEKATDFTDNIGFSVTMPGGKLYLCGFINN